jgi:hypothetical protein
MRVYSASYTGTLAAGENILLQLETSPDKRGRLSGWTVSFDAIVAGNNLSISLVEDSSAGDSAGSDSPAVMDGSHQTGPLDTEIGMAYGFSTNPTLGRVVDGPYLVSDTSMLSMQYASGEEPVLGNNARYSLRCTPSNLTVPVGFKVNLIFVA